jgi:hypothetical protein
LTTGVKIDVYGHLGALTKRDFKPETVKTQTANYFPFAIAMFQDDR